MGFGWLAHFFTVTRGSAHVYAKLRAPLFGILRPCLQLVSLVLANEPGYQ
jgi:hypothetical protein